jgi:Uma2 family endonuclease
MVDSILTDWDIHLMSPPKEEHSDIAGNFYALLWNYFEKKPCKVYFERPVKISEEIREKYKDRYKKELKKDFPKEYFIPDILVLCNLEYNKPRWVDGAPTLIIEILSKKTFKADTILKKEIYKDMGVSEYWIADPGNQWIEVFDYNKNESEMFYIDEDEDDKDVIITSVSFPDLQISLKRVFE